jgi:pimeloyl-ACP methyl ester carboxylesterase
MKRLFAWLLYLVSLSAFSQSISYPYPVRYLALSIEQQPVKMAYMDVMPSNTANGSSVLLLHGKNFNGYYWKDVIEALKETGYRVIVPDQVGFGLSDKPDIHYSFHLLAANTKKLLDSLGVSKIHVIGHSMGGMLATRFALMFPQTVEKIIYENPIGLEDYKTFVPYRSIDAQYNTERNADLESLKQYQQTYYPVWEHRYEPFVRAQWDALQIPDFKTATWASALTYQMIYEQPVFYEIKNISKPTLIIIGQEDRTVVGKNLLPKEQAAQHGDYPKLGKWLQAQIKHSKLVEWKGVGHIPHIQSPQPFKKAILDFLKV